MSPLKPGIIFPQPEVAGDVGFTREYAVAAEELGFTSLAAYEHVLGADPAFHQLSGPYSYETPFWEPFVLFGHLSAITREIDLVMGVLVLPMRQTALVAKQAATLDLLSGGRLVLGVGVGWNQVEYEALGQDFASRGRRIEEQIPLLRRLLTESTVTYEGEFDSIRHAGILPRPERRIPIWMGGWADAVLARIGRIADGWIASPGSPKTADLPSKIHTPADLERRLEIVRDAAISCGRNPSDIDVTMLISSIEHGKPRSWDPENWIDRAMLWSASGATNILLSTLDLGFAPHQHLRALETLSSFGS